LLKDVGEQDEIQLPPNTKHKHAMKAVDPQSNMHALAEAGDA